MRKFQIKYFDCNICVNGPECIILSIKPLTESCPWFQVKNEQDNNTDLEQDDYIKTKIEKEKKRILSLVYNELSDNNFLAEFSRQELEQIIEQMIRRYYMLYGNFLTAIRLTRDRIEAGLNVRCEYCGESFVVNISDDTSNCPFCNRPLDFVTIIP